MKNFFYIFFSMLLVFILCGCNFDMTNTPTKQVEKFLSKYQTLNKDVLEDLDLVLNRDVSLDENMREEYRQFMKKHYQDLTYKIKDEMIDGNNATVTAEITVRNYSTITTDTEAYRINNKDEFNDIEGNYSSSLFTKYRLEKLKEVTDKVTYTIIFNLRNENDKWQLEELSNEDLGKINGLYTN